jgi:metal-sulfur cluster biosynthetic enzyme
VLTFEPPRGRQGGPHQVHQALASVYDPEIPVNIVDLGLIYGCDVTPEGRVRSDA